MFNPEKPATKASILINWMRDNPVLSVIIGIGICAIIVMIFFAVVVVINRIGDFFRLTHQHANILGPIGDFFGGILNPIFGFCTTLILIFTLIIQKKEVIQQKKLRDYEKLSIQLEALTQEFRLLTDGLSMYTTAKDAPEMMHAINQLPPIDDDDFNRRSFRKRTIQEYANERWKSETNDPTAIGGEVKEVHNKITVSKAITLIEQIVEVYKNLINESELATLNKIHLQSLDKILTDAFMMGLIMRGKYIELLQSIESNLTKTPAGYKRTLSGTNIK